MPQFTKKAIKQSFWKLLDEKPLSKITVRDIVEACGINRNTFYYHFADLPALLDEIMRDQIELIFSESAFHSVEECWNEICRHLLKNKKAILNIYNSMNRDMLEQHVMMLSGFVANKFLTVFAMEISEEKKEVIVRFARYTLFGLGFDWMSRGMSEDIFEINRQMCEMVKDEIYLYLGIDCDDRGM